MSFLNDKQDQMSFISQDETRLNEMLSGLKDKQQNLSNAINKKQIEREGLISDINILTKRLKDLRKSIQKKKIIQNSYEQNIHNFEKGLFKISDSTKMLLDLVVNKNAQLDKEAQQ